MGTQLYILTSPTDISEAYKNSSSLSFDIFVKLLLRTCGSSKSVIEKLFQPSKITGQDKKPLGQALRDLNVRQSTTGPNFEDLSRKFLNYLDQSLKLQAMASNSRYCLNNRESGGTICVSLTRWCAEMVINGSQHGYFGDRLTQIDPNLAQTFINFDQRSWQLLYRYPRWLSKEMYSAKDQLIKALTSFFESPADTKADAAWVTKLLEKEMRDLGFDSKEMATLMMLQYWG